MKSRFAPTASTPSVNIVAEDEKAALAEAKRLRDEEADILPWENYDGNSFPINEICVEDEDGNEVAEWISDEMRLSLAAPKLFKALEFYRNIASDIESSKRKGYFQLAAKQADAALAEAKAGAARTTRPDIRPDRGKSRCLPPPFSSRVNSAAFAKCRPIMARTLNAGWQTPCSSLRPLNY